MRGQRLPRRASCSDRAEPPARSSRELLQDQRGASVDVARAERQHTVAGACTAREETDAVLDRRRPPQLHTRPGLGEGVDDQFPGHALDGLLACGIDVRYGNNVRRRQREAELAREVERARVQVRLEENEDAALVARRRDVGCELPRMMRVAVDHVDAACPTARLEPAGGTAKLAECTEGLVARVAGELDRGPSDRGGLPG